MTDKKTEFNTENTGSITAHVIDGKLVYETTPEIDFATLNRQLNAGNTTTLADIFKNIYGVDINKK